MEFESSTDEPICRAAVETHGDSLVAQTVKNLPAMQEIWIQSLGQKDPLRREWLPIQYSGLENSMDRGLWSQRVRGD